MSSFKKFLVILLVKMICTLIESHPTIQLNNQTQIRILTREEWKAEQPSNELSNLSLPVSNVIIGHTVTEECDDKEICSKKLRAVQKDHMNNKKFDDIGYNFLISSDGSIYEGRGWNKQGAHTKNHNNDSIGISLIGDFDIVEPTKEQLSATENLFEYGVSLCKISKNYRLYGQMQLRPTKSPGKFLYDIIKLWPHWTENIN